MKAKQDAAGKQSNEEMLRSGSFRAALSMDDLPGTRWYLDTDEYGGLEYWLPVSYAAKRGVRVIQPSNAKQEK